MPAAELSSASSREKGDDREERDDEVRWVPAVSLSTDQAHPLTLDKWKRNQVNTLSFWEGVLCCGFGREYVFPVQKCIL